MDEQRFLSVVAKTGNLSGDASKNLGLMNVINQVKQAIDIPYEDLFNMKQVLINEVWVMTTGKIISAAQESVMHTLRKSNLDKQIRIIGDDRLIQLIDKHFHTFWNSSTETKESVLIQRDRLLSFIENLLVANNVDKSTIAAVKSTILYSDFNPQIIKDIDGLNISNVSPYSIKLSKLDSDYDDYIVSKTYGVTKNIFQEAKKNLSYSFFDIEDIIDHADRISKITNPQEFVNETLDNLAREDPFHRPYGEASKFMDNVRYLEEGLTELKIFKQFLSSKNALESTKELAKSILDLLPEIERIIENSKEEKTIFSYSVDDIQNKINLEYDHRKDSIAFQVKFPRIDEKGFQRNKDGSLKASVVLDWTLSKFRTYIEEKFDYNEDEWLEN